MCLSLSLLRDSRNSSVTFSRKRLPRDSSVCFNWDRLILPTLAAILSADVTCGSVYLVLITLTLYPRYELQPTVVDYRFWARPPCVSSGCRRTHRTASDSLGIMRCHQLAKGRVCWSNCTTGLTRLLSQKYNTERTKSQKQETLGDDRFKKR